MKVYIVNEVQSNVCDVNTRVFSTLEQATKVYYALKEQYKDEIDADEDAEVLELHPEQKSISWDDGDFFCLLSLNTYEVEQ